MGWGKGRVGEEVQPSSLLTHTRPQSVITAQQEEKGRTIGPRGSYLRCRNQENVTTLVEEAMVALAEETIREQWGFKKIPVSRVEDASLGGPRPWGRCHCEQSRAGGWESVRPCPFPGRSWKRKLAKVGEETLISNEMKSVTSDKNRR